MRLKIDIPVLPPRTDGRRVGRVAAVTAGVWMTDLCDALRQRGYEILSLPSFWTLPEAVRSRSDVHSQYTLEVARALQRLGGVDFVLSGNTDSLLLAQDGARWQSLGEILAVPTVIWWFDDPRLELHQHVRHRMLRLYQLLDLLRSDAFHHVMIDRLMAATFAQDGFFARVRHLPVAASPQRFRPEPAPAGDAVDLVMVGNGYSGCDVRAYADEHLGPGVHDTLLRPVADRKRADLHRTLDDLLDERCAEIDDPASLRVADALAVGPGQRPHGLPRVEDEHVPLVRAAQRCRRRACRARFGPRFHLFGKHWEPTGIESAPFLADTRVHRQWYGRARVALTCNHGQLQTGVPFRLWELAASGVAIVAQACAEIESYFEPGRECEVFRTPESAPDVVERLLRDDDRRRRLAEAGLARSRHEHQWGDRLGTLLDWIAVGAGV